MLETSPIDKNGNEIPVIVYTGKDISAEDEQRLNQLSNTVILKTANSDERLVSETHYFMNHVQKELHLTNHDLSEALGTLETNVMEKSILLVDDIRNTFSLSAILTNKGFDVITAVNGQEALDKLAANADVGLVLMDIMMPVMDGLEAMQRIRAQSKYQDLPMIALTAKASDADKQDCLDAGANDFLSKPIDYEKLIALIRVWSKRLS